MNTADKEIKKLLHLIKNFGTQIETRNSVVYRYLPTMPITFTTFPLVTIRHTAVKSALQEMEWFMSGDEKCPDHLLKWWKEQLDRYGYYKDGYSKQFRNFGTGFDQIRALLGGIQKSPFSRRHIITSWNPEEMSRITFTNMNPNCPTTCHNSFSQFFVDNGGISVKTYQRSADVLLGVPHNWVQTWALLTYIAYHTGYKVGFLRWDFGDLHLYREESHNKTAELMLNANEVQTKLELKYKFNGNYKKGIPLFLAEDFSVEGDIPNPIVLTKPLLIT